PQNPKTPNFNFENYYGLQEINTLKGTSRPGPHLRPQNHRRPKRFPFSLPRSQLLQKTTQPKRVHRTQRNR
ncbi:MAG: hypothetical protein ACKO96_40355, partial [Flammeovirgaceae bacterium]